MILSRPVTGGSANLAELAEVRFWHPPGSFLAHRRCIPARIFLVIRIRGESAHRRSLYCAAPVRCRLGIFARRGSLEALRGLLVTRPSGIIGDLPVEPYRRPSGTFGRRDGPSFRRTSIARNFSVRGPNQVIPGSRNIVLAPPNPMARSIRRVSTSFLRKSVLKGIRRRTNVFVVSRPVESVLSWV